MTINNKINYKASILACSLGFISVISQILLLRELVSVFYGNEIAYAVILASWLFWVAIGSSSMSFVVNKVKDPAQLLSILLLSAGIVFPLTIIILRISRQLMHISTGEIIGIMPMCVFSYILLAPLTCILGATYTVICRYYDLSQRAESSRVTGSVYLWEAVGAAAGGLVFSFILIHFLSAMQIAFAVLVVSIFLFLLIQRWRNRLSKLTGAFFAAAIIVMFAAGLVNKLDYLTRRIQWSGFEVVSITDSIFGNIALTKSKGNFSLFENGLHVFTTDDALTSEESVHYPLLTHHNPKAILLIGNGIGGSLVEILKYKNAKVDYIEIDSKVIEISKKYLDDKYLQPLKNNRVGVKYADGRAFVKRTASKYDVVIINLGDPYTALINRCYTFEFFKEVKRILKAGGILSLSVSSSENYLNDETRDFLKTINTTLKKVFADVKSIPGDTNIFLACTEKDVLVLNPGVLAHRLKERGIETTYVREYYMPFRLSNERLEYINNILKDEGEINTDMRSIAYLYNAVLFSTHFNTVFRNIFKSFRKIEFHYLMIIPVLIFLVGFLLQKKTPAAGISISIMTTGFSEIVFQIVVILAFQSLYGYAYYKIGIIISSFMAGIVFGVLSARQYIGYDFKKTLKVYRITQLAICIYPLVLPVVFVVFRDFVVAQKFVWLFASVFAVLPVIAGFIAGVQYPMATHIVSVISKSNVGEVARPAGFLYSIDALGAAIGAIIVATFFIPLYGIDRVVILCSLINVAVLMFLLCAGNSCREV